MCNNTATISLLKMPLSKLLFTLFLFDSLAAFEITNFIVPRTADPRDRNDITCEFDLGNQQLYSVRLFKDDQEFFRYSPTYPDITMVFHQPGVHVDEKRHKPKCNVTACQVTLINLDRTLSAGTYLCEVSGEAPAFYTVISKKNLSVIGHPRGSPQLIGLTVDYFYHLNDTLLLNCTAPEASVPPIIKFYVNDVSVAPEHIVAQVDSAPDEHELITRSLLLKIQLERELFRPRLQLKCEMFVPYLNEFRHTTKTLVPMASGRDNDEFFVVSGGARPTTIGVFVFGLLFLCCTVRNLYIHS